MRAQRSAAAALLLLGALACTAQERDQPEASGFVVGLSAFNQRLLQALETEPTRRVLVLPLADLSGRGGQLADFVTEQLVTAVAAAGSYQIVDSGQLQALAAGSGLAPLELPGSEVYQLVAEQYANTSIIVGSVTDLGSRVAVMARVLRGQSGQIVGAALVYLRAGEEISALLQADRARPPEQQQAEPTVQPSGQETLVETPIEDRQEPEPVAEEQPGQAGDELPAEDDEEQPAEDLAAEPEPDPCAELAGRDEDSVYAEAREHCTAARYDQARRLFDYFLSAWPDSPLADNAAYWIGECYYAQKLYSDALLAFRRVTEDYPFGNKLPAAMLKTGYTLEQLGGLDEAIRTLEQLIERFGQSEEAESARRKLQLLRAAAQ